MNANYKLQIENACMERRLLNIDNIGAIEELLDRESQRLERLQKLKKDNKLNRGDKVSPGELKGLFPQICTEVDDFLGVQDGEVPKFGYYNLLRPGLMTTPVLAMYAISAVQVVSAVTCLITEQNPDLSNFMNAGIGAMQFACAALFHSVMKNPGYNRLLKRVTLQNVARTDLIPSAGHEYAHHVQRREGLKDDMYSIFKEGHARGVEKHIAQDYQQREDNNAFLYDVLNSTVGEFKSAYIWICQKFGHQPKASLLKTKTSTDIDERVNRLLDKTPTPHAIGNALFSIYEAREGRGIYNDMIHGNFQFI